MPAAPADSVTLLLLIGAVALVVYRRTVIRWTFYLGLALLLLAFAMH